MNEFKYSTLCHHGIKGQKWGVTNEKKTILNDEERKARLKKRIKTGATVSAIVLGAIGTLELSRKVSIKVSPFAKANLKMASASSKFLLGTLPYKASINSVKNLPKIIALGASVVGALGIATYMSKNPEQFQTNKK